MDPAIKKPAALTSARCGYRGRRCFREGDGACVHRMKFPGGGLSCVARFRFGPTHSLWLPPVLGRNLITVFSTVNTLRPLFSARQSASCGQHATLAMPMGHVWIGGIRPQRFASAKKQLVLRTLRGAASHGDQCAHRHVPCVAHASMPIERTVNADVGTSAACRIYGAAQARMRQSAQTFPKRIRAVQRSIWMQVRDPHAGSATSLR